MSLFGNVGRKNSNMFNLNNTPIFCINLKKRTDRKEKMENEFKKFNLNVEFWPAHDASKIREKVIGRKAGEYNAKQIIACMRSHRSIIKHCKECGYEHAIIFEDDIQLCDDFIYRIKYIEKFGNFDLMYLAGHCKRISDGITYVKDRYINKANQIGGTYAYIISSSIYDYVLENMNENYGTDEFYAEFVQKKFNCFIFIPTLAYHEDGYSDIAKTHTKYKYVNKLYAKRI